MYTDFVLNGEGHGPVGSVMQGARFDPNLLRPYINDSGIRCVSMQTGKFTVNAKGRRIPEVEEVRLNDLWSSGVGVPLHVMNALALTRDAWTELDRAIVMATRQEMTAWTDLAAASTRGGFDAMSKMTVEYQSQTDLGEAVQDMDALTDARTDRPLYDLKSVPLPITHSDFWFSKREIAVSRGAGAPGVDVTQGEAAGRRVAEFIERQVIGTEAGMTFGTQSTGVNAHTGTSTIYGMTTFPYRQRKTDLTVPTGSNPEAINTDILEMIELMHTAGFTGPFMLYHSTPYSRFLNDDYFRTGSTSAVRSVRERVMQNEDIKGIKRLNFLTSGYQLILMQMDSRVAQAIDGMGITTVQWASQGDMRQNFKVMAIRVPLFKTPYNGVAGIVHGTTS